MFKIFTHYIWSFYRSFFHNRKKASNEVAFNSNGSIDNTNNENAKERKIKQDSKIQSESNIQQEPELVDEKLLEKINEPIDLTAKEDVLEKSTRKKIKLIEKKIPTYTFIRIEDIPDEIENRTIYIVGEKGFEWLVVLKCPCGCNEIIQLNMLKETKPRWRIICYKNKSISVIPSVHRIVNCKSHFTITKGEIRWWGDSDYEET